MKCSSGLCKIPRARDGRTRGQSQDPPSLVPGMTMTHDDCRMSNGRKSDLRHSCRVVFHILPRDRSLDVRIFLPLFLGGLLLATIGGNSRHAIGQNQVPGFNRAATSEQDPTASVYLPTDRTLSRAVTRAKERLAQNEYHEALQFLHGLLGREEDWFFNGASGATERQGVKATARQLIGTLGPEGRDAYERLDAR